MRKTGKFVLLLLVLVCHVYASQIVITPTGGDDASRIQTTMDTLQAGDTLILLGDFVIARTIYLPSDFTWILNGSLSLSENVDLDRVGYMAPGVDARRPTGITEKPGGATHINMSGGTYYGYNIRDGSKSIRFLNFVSVTHSLFHDFTVMEGSDDGFTLGPGSRYNECHSIVGTGAHGNALTDKGAYNKWFDCIAEDCGSDGWTPKCRYSEFHRCIGRRNAGPGFGCFARLDGSGDPVDLGEIIEGNIFMDCEAYDNQRGGFSFNIASTSGSGSIVRDNHIQAVCYNNRMQGVGFRNKQPDGIIENNEIDILVYGNLGLKGDGTLSSYAGGLGVEGTVSAITGSLVGYNNGGYDVNVKSATDCIIEIYHPGSQNEPVLITGSNTLNVTGFTCQDLPDSWCQHKYCEQIYPLLPDAPAELSADSVSSDFVDLSWSDMSGNEEGFLVERKESDQFTIIDTLEANTSAYSDKWLLPETAYGYRLRSYNAAGFSAYSNEVTVTTEAIQTSDRDPNRNIPIGLSVYPNPFRAFCRLTFNLIAESSVSLKIFDPSGRMVHKLDYDNKPAGTHTILLEGRDLPGGPYFCILHTGSTVESQKIIRIK